MSAKRLNASFRDPSGFLFEKEGILFRQVNSEYQPHYDRLDQSGLYERLVEEELLIAHQEVAVPGLTDGAYKVLQPDRIPYISYPYEWSFSQLKEAALLTLKIQRQSLAYGMSLKDASAFNVQFLGSQPVFIDSLSFETYEEGVPWVAYKQFCQHFLGPLALLSCTDLRLQHLLKTYLDGLPLDLVSGLLPSSTKLRYSLLAHIHLHSKSQIRYQNAGNMGSPPKLPTVSKRMLEALISSLESAVRRLKLPKLKTEWGDYYVDTNYSVDSMSEKERVVLDLLKQYAGQSECIHDIGANTGRFSNLAARFSDYVVAHDVDQLAVERHYLRVRSTNSIKVLPLVLDLTNPTPNLGWNLKERMSFSERTSGLVMALAVIHHLAISNNVPLRDISRVFRGLADKLLIEFVPKSDSQVKRLLFTRKDIYPDYSVEGFESAFATDFETVQKVPIEGSERILYFMKRSRN